MAHDVQPQQPLWWQQGVIYQVYPRSFADADGDGVGDLPGLRSRLGYLADLGVDAIWLTPFYPSPLADGGYDVSDYCAVDPLLGTMADFDALISGAAARQIRVIIDLVPNHCSAPTRSSAPRWPPCPAATSGPGSSSATAAAPAATNRRTTGRRSSAAPRGPGYPRPTGIIKGRGSGTCTCSTPASPTGTGTTRTCPRCSRT